MKELKIENQWIWKQQQQEQILITISINNKYWNKKTTEHNKPAILSAFGTFWQLWIHYVLTFYLMPKRKKQYSVLYTRI